MTPISTTLAQLVNAEPVLTRLLTVPASVKTAYRLSKLAKAVEPELAFFHDKRTALIRELGEALPDTETQTGVFRVLATNMAAFTERISELGNVPILLHADPLTLDLLDAVPCSGQDLLTLGPLVVVEDPV